MLIPSRPLLLGLLLLFVLAVVASFAPAWDPLLALAALTVFAAAGVDAVRLLRRGPPVVRRRAPHALALGADTRVELRIEAADARPLSLDVFDHAPAECRAAPLPQSVRIAAGETATLQYTLRAEQRGEQHFGHCELRLHSPWQLWRRRVAAAAPARVRVYPNFVALTRFALLATDHRLSQLGVLQRRRRGEGLEFHQLREYREGDAQRQVDWKASARMRRLVSREYRDERDQQIVLLLDCGRRMLSRDGALSHFDHALNAALLLADVALRQGDAVGLLTMGGVQRWVPPRKSGAMLNALLAASYDLQPTHASPDFQAAAIALATRLKKRAMVLWLTNLRDEDDDDLAAAVSLLRRRHLVVLASLREPVLDAALRAPIAGLDDALTHAATADYLEQRRRAFARMEQRGVPCIDVEPAALPLALVNRYVDIKRSGRL